MPSRDLDALQIRDLRKSYGSRQAIDGISFSLPVGQRLAFLGPNGAGKTTLIRCLAGRTRPDEGEIRLLDKPIGDPLVRRLLGVVPQEIALYADLTARQNLNAFGRFYGVPRRQLADRVDWALHWSGLESRADDRVGSFSGGMQRRVNLGCGVLHQPSVVLLDEPTVGVDPQSRQRIFAMLDQLHARGTTLLLTTHHLDEAEQHCDRIVIIDGGKVIADGNLTQLVDQTVGRSRIVRLRVDRPLIRPIELPDPTSRSIGSPGESVITTRVDDAAGQLAIVLDSTRRSGYQISDVEVHSPTLHHVFLHLTGHELRD